MGDLSQRKFEGDPRADNDRTAARASELHQPLISCMRCNGSGVVAAADGDALDCICLEQRPRLLDLFCGAGGAAMGYHRAGFEVVGVDLHPQPHYPFEFHQADAIEVLRYMVRGYGALGGQSYATWSVTDFDAIHASPPCQAYTLAGALRTETRLHPKLVEPTRELLRETWLPWVIENVPGAPLINPVQLCGTAFGLGWTDWELQRHRLFESNIQLAGTDCHHWMPAISVVGHGATKATRERLGRNPAIAEKRHAMGIDWMNRDELSEAIPPAYGEFIGRQLMAYVRRHAPWHPKSESEAVA